MPKLSLAPNHRPRRPQPLLACLLAAAFPLTALATSRTYTGGDNSSFGAATSWNPNGAPASGDTLNLGATAISGLGGNLDVTVNLVTTGITAANFDSTALPGAFIITETGGTLGVTTETFNGSNAGNTYNLTQGSANVADTLNIATSSTAHDLYTVSGTGSTLTATSNLWIGVDGTGTLTQSDGFVNVHNPDNGGATLILGADSGSTGTYNLSGGNLTIDDFQIAGAGNGVFNQSGGNLTVSAVTFFSAFSGQTATYNYSGGTASFNGGLTVGNRGIFNLKSGGSLPFNLTVASGGIFNLAGGSFGAGIVTLNSGTFQLNGHAFTYSHVTGNGTIQDGSSTAATLTLSPSTTDSFAGTLADGTSSAALSVSLTTGTFTLSGGNSYSGTTTISGGTLKAGTNNTFSGNSLVNITGGTLDAQNFQNVINSLAGTSSGTVNINAGGELIAFSTGANTTYSGKFTGAGEFAKGGTNTLTLSGTGASSAFTGNILVQGGTLAPGVVDGIPTNVPVELTVAAASLSIPFSQHIATLAADSHNNITFSNGATLSIGAGNANSTLIANFSGSGTLVKNGTATLTIGGGATDTTANIDTSLSTTINTGSVLLSKAPGTNALAGNINVAGGNLTLNGSDQIADTATVNTTAGTFNLNNFNETIGGLTGATGSVTLGTGNLTVANTITESYSSVITGTGTLTKTNTGILDLSDLFSFSGSLSATGGTLAIINEVNAASYSASSGGTLQLGFPVTLAPGTMNATGGTIAFTGANSPTIGDVSGNPATVTIGTGGTFSTGTSATTINATGKITQSDGNFNLNGDLTVTGGAVTQTGGTFTWAAGHTMTVQSAGNVTFAGFTQTPANATINVTGANSQLNVSGTGSAYLDVGGGSTVSAKLGASVHSDLYFFIGDSTGSGSITVDGANSSLTSSALINFGESSIGTVGTGALTFSNSATGTIPNGFELGNAGGSNGTLSVLSNASITTGPIDVATGSSAATGSILVNGGILAQSRNTTLAIGGSFLGTGTVTVSGGGLFQIFPGGTVTINPTGTFNIQPDGFLAISANVTNSGTVNFLGNIGWDPNDAFTNNAGVATFSSDQGSSSFAFLTLTLNGGTVLLNGSQHLHALNVTGGTLGGHGRIFNSVTFGSAPITIAPSATLPASSIGSLELPGLSTTPNLTLSFNLKTPNIIGGADEIVIDDFQGLALNGGKIQIANTPTGPASLGYYEIFLYISTLQGAGISSMTLPPITNNIAYTLDITHDPGHVDIHRGFLGDANDDGTVDLNDLNTVLNHLGTATTSWTNGNFDTQPTIDLTDLNDVLNHLGTTNPNPTAAQTATPTPEPTSLTLAGLSFFAFLVRRNVRL